MADRFGVGDWAAAKVDGSGLAVDLAEALTGRAGLLGAKQGGFAFQKIGDGRAGHDSGGVIGNPLDLIGIEFEVGSDLFVNPTGDDFSPALGDPVKFNGVNSRRLMEGHRRSVLGLRE